MTKNADRTGCTENLRMLRAGNRKLSKAIPSELAVERESK